MIPIVLDPARLRLGLAGRGEAFHRRLHGLRRGGAALWLFSDDTDAEPDEAPAWPLAEAGGAGLDVLWIVGLADAEAATLAAAARRGGALVNVEDVKAQCDFHNVAAVRRGDLLLTVSTGGQSPGLAARLRADLARRYGAEWGERLRDLGQRREDWRREGADIATLARRSDAAIDAARWFA